MSSNSKFPSSVEEYTAEIEAGFSVIPRMSDPLTLFEDECLRSFGFQSSVDEFNLVHETNGVVFTEVDSDHEGHRDPRNGRRTRSVDAYGFAFGDVFESNWYKKFLHPDSRERTYHLSSRDRFGDFRSLFRLTLEKIDGLVSLFMDENWVYKTKHCRSEEELFVKTELHIMAVMRVLGHHSPFRTLSVDTNICASEHRSFFHSFITRMTSIKDRFIAYPSLPNDLQEITKRYEENFLPGCGGSVDVVHVKWSKCPAGDYNRCKGKEGYPSVSFEVITGYDRQVLGVSAVHFGTRNDQQIVRTDETVHLIRTGWYRNVKWEYFDASGNIKEDYGIYLICDEGYLRWPQLVCPYKHESVSSQKGYFSARVESVRKDVECVFGILKKRWKILDFGMRFHDINVVEKIFVVCCILHNNMLSEMDSTDVDIRVGCGVPLPGDGIWLHGDDRSFGVEDDRVLSTLWGKRRNILAEHVHYCATVSKSYRMSIVD